MTIIKFSKPGEMNLAGYFLKNILERSIIQENKHCIQITNANVLITVSSMKITVRFKGEEIEILQGEVPPIHASVKGGMTAFLQAYARKKYLVPILAGRLRVGGNVLKLIPLLRSLKA